MTDIREQFQSARRSKRRTTLYVAIIVWFYVLAAGLAIATFVRFV